MMKAVEIRHLYKIYQSADVMESLVQNLLSLGSTEKASKKYALEDVSFYANKGESVGIIGKNGSGKSTLLKIIGGVTGSTYGELHVHGKVVSLLEVGAGFSLLLTGRENIYLNGILLGLSKQEIEKKIDSIIEFSGIGNEIDRPTYQYSSGMYVRLGFAIAAHSEPDILIVDEALSVGDHEFQAKSIEAIEQLKENGKTLIFVSHDLGIVQGICDRVYLLEKGKVVHEGIPEAVVPYYLQTFPKQNAYSEINLDNVRLIFNAGNLALYINEISITKMYGLYCSFFAFQGWHDSDQASWKIVRQEKHKLVAHAKSRRLPMEMRWEVEILSSKINIKIYLKKKKDFVIDGFQTSIMLSKQFSSWEIGEKSGVFPKRPEKTLNDWQHLNTLGEEKSNHMSAFSSHSNTTIDFEHDSPFEYLPTPIVTSKDLNANVLQFLLARSSDLFSSFERDETLMFSGSITIHE
ncbi:MAG: ABC transporter ATP-binding protein [Bdellovibrionota bacterium]